MARASSNVGDLTKGATLTICNAGHPRLILWLSQSASWVILEEEQMGTYSLPHLKLVPQAGERGHTGIEKTFLES
jgi:hypothetical protein